MTWADEVREAAPDVLDVAAHLGLTVSRRRLGPCPACGRAGHHLPITPRHGGRGWLCAACKAGGDVIRLAAWVTLGRDRAQTGEEWGQVRARLAAGGWCSADGDQRTEWTPPPPRPPQPELPYPDAEAVRWLLTSSLPVTSALPVVRWCESRGYDPRAIPARVLPELPQWPEWWPYGARPWRLVVPAVDAAGVVRSIHARATEPTERGKTRWPRDCRASGLLFADAAVARPMLRGAPVEVRRILVVEGVTDYLAAAGQRDPGTAVLGACSGGFGALAGARLPAVPVYVATDSDPAGERYAAEVARALPVADLRRVVLPHGRDVADLLAGGGEINALLTLARCNGPQ